MGAEPTHRSREKRHVPGSRDNVKLNGVVFYPTENVVSEERMFRVGQLHYTNSIPLGKIPLYREMGKTALRAGPHPGTYFFLLNTTRPPLDDAGAQGAVHGGRPGEAQQNRSQGLERTRLQHHAPDTRATTRRSCSLRRGAARELLAEAGYPTARGWPGLELTYNTSEDHRKIAVALQQMWKDALNIEVTLTNQEEGLPDSVTQMNFQIARRGWIGDYVDPNNFLDLYLTGGGNNNTGFSDPRYDDMILHQAPQAATRERFDILRAETLLMEQMPIIPIYTYTSKHPDPP